MSPQEYITQELNDFSTKFPKIKAYYEYDQLSYVHFIEIFPKSAYHLDKAYIAWESKMYDKFTYLFPDQNICFL